MSETKNQIARRPVPMGQLLINGKWKDALDGATMPTIDPTTEEVTTVVAKASPADADEAVRAAARAFEHGPWGKMQLRRGAGELHPIQDHLGQPRLKEAKGERAWN
jgi:aldehyde dehydrogenase (NAD+)